MTSIRLRGAGDFLASLPYQLGYHPDDAVLVVALQGRAVGMIGRVDLPPLAEVQTAVGMLVPPLLREQPDGVMLVGYESRVDAAMPLLTALRSDLLARGVHVVDTLVVRAGRWYAHFRDDGRCPADGQPLPAPEDIPAVADFIALGVAPLPTRDALAALVAADPRVCSAVAAALHGTTGLGWAGQALGLPRGPSDGSDGGGAGDEAPDDHALAVRRLSWLSSWAVVCDVSETARAIDALSCEEVAELVASLGDVDLRDGLVAWLCPGALPLDLLAPDLADAIRCTLPAPSWSGRRGDHAAAVARGRLTARLQWLVRAIPDSRAAPALTVLASLTWWAGDGALTRVALDRALEHAPDYRLALLLQGMVDLGVRPRGREVAALRSA